MADDASILRTVMARECDTVNEYEALAAAAQTEDVRRLMLHIAREEREHIAVCARMLAKVDAEFSAWLERDHPPLGPDGRRLAAPPPAAPPAEPPADTPRADAAPPLSNRLTIGSLIRR